MNEIEILNLNNIKNHFPSHFHNYYVFGFIEKGCRNMICNGKEYILNPGSMVVFNPFDVHQCKNINDDLMQYFALNVKNDFIKEIFEGNMPNFENVINSSKPFHFLQKSAHNKKQFAKILKNIPHSFENDNKNFSFEIEMVCKIIEQNFSNKISLEFLADSMGLSKSTLLRAFLKAKGITPYRYIESLRINKAKFFLSKGVSILETAFQTGFSSQSHFTNSFKSLTGLTPCMYQKGLKIYE